MDPVRTSKLLSRVLRHDPAAIGITLDPAGWIEVDTLLSALRAHGHRLSAAELRQLVSASDKQRFALDPATNRIRANQGHCVDVDLGLAPDVETARWVGARRGRCVVLVVRAGAMHQDGHLFSVSDNGVWLTRQVPARYLSSLGEASAPGSG